MNLKNKIANKVNLLGGSLPAMIDESTQIIFDLIKKPDQIETRYYSDVTKIQWGRFYLFLYDYNGNKMWCPVFTLPPPIKEKIYPNVVYGINLGYLPYRYRIELFNYFFESFSSIVDKNDDAKEFLQEENFKKITFEYVYKILQSISSGMQYCITGYNLLKIKKCYGISTKIADRFVMLNLNRVNRQNMKDLLDKLDQSPEKDQLKDILSQFDQIMESYTMDSEKFYQDLKKLEPFLKLFESE